jgi:hypothetical protein
MAVLPVLRDVARRDGSHVVPSSSTEDGDRVVATGTA